jgi:glycosyltransferase involved in cell wall biosynthesis
LNLSHHNNITVSVVIPTYNSGDTLIRAFESVYSQSINVSIEIIVVDDGSIDNTQVLIEKYHHPINYLYQSNNGVASARNKGIMASKGSYIAFLDADDEWLPSKLEEQLIVFNKNPKIHIVSTGMVDIYQNGEIRPTFHPYLSGDLFYRLVFYNPIGTSSVMIKKEVFNNPYLRFDNVSNVGEDWLLWVRMSARYDIVIIPDILVNRYLFPGSLENKVYNIEKRKDIFGIYNALKNDTIVKQRLEAHRINRNIFITFHQANILYYDGKSFEAFLTIIKILKHLPIYLIYRQLVKYFIHPIILNNFKILENKFHNIKKMVSKL